MIGALFHFPSLIKVGKGAAPRELLVKTLRYLQEEVTSISCPRLDTGLANGLNALPCAIMRGMERWEEEVLVEFSAFPHVKFLEVSGTQREGPGLDPHCPFPTYEDYLLSGVFQQQKANGQAAGVESWRRWKWPSWS